MGMSDRLFTQWLWTMIIVAAYPAIPLWFVTKYHAHPLLVYFFTIPVYSFIWVYLGIKLEGRDSKRCRTAAEQNTDALGRKARRASAEAASEQYP